MSNYGLTSRKPNRQPPRTDLTVAQEMNVHGRRVVAGQPISVYLPPRKTALRVTFRQAWRTADGREWVDVQLPNGNSRTIRPDAVKTVHRKRDPDAD